MRTSRRVAVAAACMTLAVAAVASPVQAAPPNAAKPGVVNSAKDVGPEQLVPKDAKGRAVVYVDGARESLRAAIDKAGGSVANAGKDRVKAVVPQDKLDLVASQPGVTGVRLPDRAVPMGVASEGFSLSRANEWVESGKTGAGVKIGIIDIGFGKLAEAQTAGELPPTGQRLSYNNAGCLDATVKSEHGTNVAEVVHDMAPGADLYLACVEDSFSFADAAEWLRQQNVQVIAAAIGFLSPSTGGRGDGTGVDANSPAEVVRRSREAGILWSVAAGNLARTHFAGNPVDVNNNKWVEFRNGVEWNSITLASKQTATVSIRWDAWPKTNEDLDLYVMDQGTVPDAPGAPAPVAVSRQSQKDTPGGLAPTEELTFTNNAASGRTFYIFAKNNNARFTTPFELFVAGPEQLQYSTARGSIVEPATSPHVIAVGATEPGSGQVEEFSGRGPTIDGRFKPDIVAFDKVSTSTWHERGFSGTSAAAAHVAGAAAILKSATPSLDASQLQQALQGRAVSPANVDRNTWGSGVLNLGAPTIPPAAPVGSAFTADPVPTRVQAAGYEAGEVKNLAFDVPGTANAVAITVHARTDGPNTGDFAIEVGTGDLAAKDGKVPTLYARGDTANSWQSLTLFAPLDNTRSLKLRHRGAGKVSLAVDRLGYFSPSPTVSTNTYFAKTKPERVLDTRGYAGSPRNTALNASTGESVDVQIRGAAGVPANATAVVANLTAFEASEKASLVAHAGAATQVPATTSVAVSPGDRRTNLVVVPIRSDGKIRLSSSGGSFTFVGAALDVVGWFAEDTAGAKYVPLPDSSRVADTSVGNGLPKAPVGPGQTATFQVSGMAGIASAATTAAVVMTGQDDLVGTELSVAASEVGWSAATQVGTRRMETAAGLALVPLGKSGKVGVRNERGQTRLTADVTGYFVGGAKVPDSGVAGNCVTSSDEPGFTSAFDGRIESGLGGWRSNGTAMTADGCELVTADGVDTNWYAAHTYGNEYTVKLDWKATAASSDSGVYVLMKNPGTTAGRPENLGHEIQIASTSVTDPVMQTGAIVGAQGPNTTTAVKPVGEWNTFEIKVRWNQVTVYLNGQLVNEYSRPDATTVPRDTFIGLQNDNVGQPVRFRNIRVKRDSPVRSGAVRAQNDMCLDVLNADPTLAKVHMVPCVGNWAQTWTMSNNVVQAGGRCLGVPNGNLNAVVQLLECSGTDLEQWVSRGDGRLVSRESGRCLSPVTGSQGSGLELRNCATSDSAQVWRLPEQNGKSGQVVGPGAKCLDVPNNRPWTNRAGVYPCNATQAQTWTAPGDGTLRAGGKCLDVNDGKVVSGSPVAISDCNGSQAQQWVSHPDGTLVNPVSGRCLTSEPQDWSPMTITDCDAGPKQRWRMSATAVTYGSLVSMATKCMDLFNAQPTGNIVLHDCNGTTAQQWSVVGDGTIRILGHCLDIPNGNEDTVVALNSSCRGNLGQVWSVRPDASVANTWAGMCLDVRNGLTDNGTQLQIHRCNSSPAQQWATPVLPT